MQTEYYFDQPPGLVVGLCAHGLSVVRALRDGSVPVIALETNLDLPGVHTRLAHVEQIDDINGPRLIDALLALRPRVHCPGTPVLFLTNDNMVRTLAAHWHLLSSHYLLSWAHCRDTIALLIEKSHLEAHCQKQGSPYPSTYLLHAESEIEAAIDATGGVSIVKPARPLAGFKTAFPQQRLDYEQLIQRFEVDLPFLVQRFIPGEDDRIYFCALYLHHGEVLARFDGRKLRSRPLGHTTIAESCFQEDVYRETLRFFAGLDLSGPVSVEFKRDAEGRLWVIEPTLGRTDFWLGVCTANQVNLPLAEYRSQTSLPPQRAIQNDSVVWFNEERDPFARLWLALHRDLGLGRRHPSYLFLHANDIVPALLSQKKLFSDLACGALRRVRRFVSLGSARTQKESGAPGPDGSMSSPLKEDSGLDFAGQERL
jgi:D-aspartate ligase